MDYLIVGRLGKPHGVGGEIEVTPFSDFPHRFDAGSELLLIPPLETAAALRISGSKPKKNKIVLKFRGIDTVEEALVLQGRELAVEETKAMKLQPDEFWIHQLVGLRVVTEDGRDLGKVVEVSRSAAHDLYVVENDKRHLIPAVREIVTEVDLKKGLMIISPPPGLLEL